MKLTLDKLNAVVKWMFGPKTYIVEPVMAIAFDGQVYETKMRVYNNGILSIRTRHGQWDQAFSDGDVTSESLISKWKPLCKNASSN